MNSYSHNTSSKSSNLSSLSTNQISNYNNNSAIISGSFTNRAPVNKTEEEDYSLNKQKRNSNNCKNDKNIFSNISNRFINFFGNNNNNKDKDKEKGKLQINDKKKALEGNNPNQLNKNNYDFYNINTNNEEDIFSPHRNISNNEIHIANIHCNISGRNSTKKSNSVNKHSKVEREEEHNKENLLMSIFQNNPKILKFYQEADYEKKNLIENYLIYEVHNIIKEFIPHFANFNFETSDAIDLLVETCSKYRMQKENISYYVTFLHSCYYSIKNKFGHITNSAYKFNDREKKKFRKENKIDIIFNLNYYLDDASLMNLVQINREFYSKYNHQILRNIIKKDEQSRNLTNKNRINIWKILLKVVKKLFFRIIHYTNIYFEIYLTFIIKLS